MKKLLKFITPILIFGLTFIPMLYKINNPVADWHSWRQADTAAVSRNFVKDNFNLLYPQSDSLLPLNPKQLPNPDRLFINEFPFYNAIVAVLYQNLGINETLARLVSVIFSSLGAVFLYLLAKKLFSNKIALTTSLFYAFNPYNVYYGRVIMPDPTFVSLSIVSFYYFVNWVDSKKVFQGLLMTLSLALAMLVKPYAVFMIIPMIYFAFLKQGVKIFKFKQAYLFSVLAFIPVILWRYHYHLHPEANFDTNWLFNQTNIRFTGAFFRWLIFDRLNRLIFATGGFVLFILGLLDSVTSKTKGLIFTWLASVFLYMTIFAMGNVTHDYYQLPIMPVGSILVSLGFWSLVNKSKKISLKLFNSSIALVLLVLSFAFGWYEVRGFFNINRPEIVIAGQAVDQKTPQNSIVIAPYQADPAFLYQTNRYGWPIGVDIESKIKKGATHYISVNHDDVAKYLETNCQLVEKTDQYVLIDLQACQFKTK